MWHLYQFPLCPFSRKVRLLMSENGIAYELQTEKPWEGRDGFLAMNPAGRVPVLTEEERGITLADSRAICEFFEETVERNPLISGTAVQRAPEPPNSAAVELQVQPWKLVSLGPLSAPT